MAVKEKQSQGGGLGPVVVGEDHLPEEGEVTQLVLLAFLVKSRYSYMYLVKEFFPAN